MSNRDDSNASVAAQQDRKPTYADKHRLHGSSNMFYTYPMTDLHQQIAELEDEIDALSDAAEQCRKSMVVAKVAAGIVFSCSWRRSWA
jgi:hypothetical protein